MTLIQQEPDPVSLKKSAMLSSWRNRSAREDAASPLAGLDSGRFRKISDIMVQVAKESDSNVRKSSLLPSNTDVRHAESDWHSHLPKSVAVAVTSEQGETLELKTRVMVPFLLLYLSLTFEL